eukprot:TRINITY_DN26784_c0_g1_i1.p2 TRINITY_DN26784_c0_g1~~TRINITY_DN26784_c0_g1_i1.p2  ORF type:complete len:105 (+),score=9.99 TRINITY_DN26784_c0_g1_i1:53-367(+)
MRDNSPNHSPWVRVRVGVSGVHENMCILGRPFAIEQAMVLGFDKQDIAVVRELVDVMYTPKDPPYVTHAQGLAIHTDYIERFWGSSVSMYDVLTHAYNTRARAL